VRQRDARPADPRRRRWPVLRVMRRTGRLIRGAQGLEHPGGKGRAGTPGPAGDNDHVSGPRVASTPPGLPPWSRTARRWSCRCRFPAPTICCSFVCGRDMPRLPPDLVCVTARAFTRTARLALCRFPLLRTRARRNRARRLYAPSSGASRRQSRARLNGPCFRGLIPGNAWQWIFGQSIARRSRICATGGPRGPCPTSGGRRGPGGCEPATGSALRAGRFTPGFGCAWFARSCPDP
jgi:hypothetical protein